MKKIIITALILFTASLLYANPDTTMHMSMKDNQNTGFIPLGLYPNIPKSTIKSVTFYADYTRGVNAKYSKGSPVAGFTATRDATHPATYIDESGVINTVTTSAIPRFNKGYYDATGFHAYPSLLNEASSANLVPKSYTMNDATWTATTTTVADGDTADPAGGTNAASLTASAGNGTVILTTAVTAATYSVWLKRKTGSGNVDITANGGTTWVTQTLNATWRRFSVTATSASQKCGIRIVTNTDAVYAYGSQFENIYFASSFIPTTAGALTRNAESLYYALAGNRTAESETIIVKCAPEFAQVAAGGNTYGYPELTSTDTKNRSMRWNQDVAVNGGFLFYPNNTDNAGSDGFITGLTIADNASCVYAGVAVAPTGDPNTLAYLNGANTVSDNTDWTTPAWSGNFVFGGPNCAIQKVEIFNRALTASEAGQVSNSL